MRSCWPGLSDVSESRLRPSPTSTPAGQAQACLKQAQPNQQPAQARPASPAQPAQRPGASQGMPAALGPALSPPAGSAQRQGQVCLTCLRLANDPAQPATHHPASVAHPATRPSTAQPSPPSPSSSATSSVVRLPGSQQPTMASQPRG